MTSLSILDLSPIRAGGSAGEALRNTLDLARRSEAAGYERYWLAEHHFTPGVASAPSSEPSIAHVIGRHARTCRLAARIVTRRMRPLTG